MTGALQHAGHISERMNPVGHRFLEIVGTPAVHAAQAESGSRRSYARMEGGPPNHDRIGEAEAAFISARDSFYIASVSATGWPYLQHRGGLSGFLKVLDPQLLGFADYAGNKQYVTLGNTATDDRVALFLMDYPNRRRLKILGRIALVAGDDDPELAARLADGGEVAERLFVIRIEAFDWNCPQHITPRYAEAHVEAAVEPLRRRLIATEAENTELRAQLAALSKGKT